MFVDLVRYVPSSRGSDCDLRERDIVSQRLTLITRFIIIIIRSLLHA